LRKRVVSHRRPCRISTGASLALGVASAMIEGLSNADALPVLERLMQFAGERHRIIANNVANLSTPGFRPGDVSVAAFQEQLGDAIDRRRSSNASASALSMKPTPQVEVIDDDLVLRPQPIADNLLFHDGNDRDLERTMQGLVENFMVFRTAAQFLQSRFDLLNTAIRERI
jgi:flagellar basal-body rod protein FlgB